MKILLMTAMFLIAPISWADRVTTSYKCISHRTFEFSKLEITWHGEFANPKHTFILDGKEIKQDDDFLLDYSWHGLLVVPLDQRTFMETDEIYCKQQQAL